MESSCSGYKPGGKETSKIVPTAPSSPSTGSTFEYTSGTSWRTNCPAKKASIYLPHIGSWEFALILMAKAPFHCFSEICIHAKVSLTWSYLYMDFSSVWKLRAGAT
jgi:hypothetical protein